MATLTIRMPEDKVQRLKAMAKSRGLSVNKLIEELTNLSIGQFDAQASFLARAARGSRERGLDFIQKMNERDASASHAMHDSAKSELETMDELRKKALKRSKKDK